MLINDTAFLCGYFSVKSSVQTGLFASQENFWTRVQYEDTELSWARTFYYPEFADFMMSDVKTYSHVYDRDIEITLRDGSAHKVTVAELRVYEFPFGIFIYSIKVQQNGVEMQNALDALYMMRGIFNPDQAALGEYITFALDPIKSLCVKAGYKDSYASLIESGNKLKIYHTLLCPEIPQDAAAFDDLLYGGGTLAVYKEDDPMGFTREYYSNMMSRNRISVFNNWKGLSLTDTFTIVASDPKDYMLRTWHNEYFGRIYLYALYRKFFLFRINGDYRSEVKPVSAVCKELAVFERDYTFPTVSYNFLPEIIFRSMSEGLDIEGENVKVAEMINRENTRREAETGDKMNLFLGVITCLTLFSAIWDFACLMDGVFEFSTNIGTATGIRACAMLLVSIICVAAIFVRRK